MLSIAYTYNIADFRRMSIPENVVEKRGRTTGVMPAKKTAQPYSRAVAEEINADQSPVRIR